MRKRWLALLFLAPGAVADCPFSCTLSWDYPTEYVSGDVLNPSDLQYSSIYCDGIGEPMVQVTAPITQFVFYPGLVPDGAHPCTVTVTDLALKESAQSNTVIANVENPPPKAPVLRI